MRVRHSFAFTGELSGATFSDEDLEKVLNSLEFEQKICRVPTLGQPTFVVRRTTIMAVLLKTHSEMT